MQTIYESDWAKRIGDKWEARNAKKKQVVHFYADKKIERWGKVVARCGTMAKIIKESTNMKEVTCKRCLKGEKGRHYSD